MTDLDAKVVAAVVNADSEHLRAALTAMLDLHREHEVKDQAGTYLYSICWDCCTNDEDDSQSAVCRDGHEHFGPLSGRCWPCTTWHVAARALRVKAPELGLM